jgi:hypothetical protein
MGGMDMSALAGMMGGKDYVKQTSALTSYMEEKELNHISRWLHGSLYLHRSIH